MTDDEKPDTFEDRVWSMMQDYGLCEKAILGIILDTCRGGSPDRDDFMLATKAVQNLIDRNFIQVKEPPAAHDAQP